MHQPITHLLCAVLKGSYFVACSPGKLRGESPNIDRPGGPHLAHGHCRVVVAQWTTRDFGTPVVRWGLQPGVVQQQGNGSYSTYTRLQMCGAPASAQGVLLTTCRLNMFLKVGCPCEQPESTQQLDHYILEAALLAGWVDPGALNFAAMTGLQPSTRYYYIVGDLVRPQRLPHMSSNLQ